MRSDRERRYPRTNYLLGLVLAEKRQFKLAVEALDAYLNAAPDTPDGGTVRKQRIEIEKRAQP